MQITFKKFTEEDMPLFLSWAEKSQVKDVWFLDGYATVDSYHPKIVGQGGYDHQFIICLDSRPIGYIQASDLYAYRVNCPNPKGVFTNEEPGSFCLDLFIGEEECMGRGYGTEIVKAFVQKLISEFKAKKILIDPACSNKRAIRCYEKAGFKVLRTEYDGTEQCCIMGLLQD